MLFFDSQVESESVRVLLVVMAFSPSLLLGEDILFFFLRGKKQVMLLSKREGVPFYPPRTGKDLGTIKVTAGFSQARAAGNTPPKKQRSFFSSRLNP